MGKPKRNFLATAEQTSTPPACLEESHMIARVRKIEGNNLYSVEIPAGNEPLLVELPSRFRSQIWIKRGGFVVVDTSAFEGRSNKLNGEIVNVVRDEKQWRKQSYWSGRPLPSYWESVDRAQGLLYSQSNPRISKTAMTTSPQ